MAIAGEDVANVGQVLDKMAQDKVASYKSLHDQITGTRRISKAVMQEMKKHQIDLMRKSSQLSDEIEKSVSNIDNLSDSEKENLKIKMRLNKGMGEQIESLVKITGGTKVATGAMMGMASAASFLAGAVTGGLSVAFAALTSAVNLVVQAYNFWFEIQEKTQEKVGQMAMALGTTPRQLEQVRGAAEGLSDTFANLTGDVLGLESFDFAQELAGSLRNVNLLTGELSSSMLSLKRGFGLTTDEAVNLYRLVAHDADDPIEAINNFGAEIMTLADSLGVPAGILMKDYAQAADNIAQFGREGSRTFSDATTMASRFGLETQKIFESVKGFDHFNQASDNVNSLNAMFGTTISSFEMMMEQDPARRLEMVRSSIMGMGLEWGNMNRYQRMQLSQTLNLTEQELKRVFEDGASFEDMERERQEAEERQRREETERIDNQRMMNEMLNQTRTFVADLSWFWERIKVVVVDALSPILQEVLGTTQNIGESFYEWVRALVQSEEFQTRVREVAEDIHDLVIWIGEKIENFDWESAALAAEQWWTWAWEIYGTISETIRALEENEELWRAIDLVVAGVQKSVDDIGTVFQTAYDWSVRIYNLWTAFSDLIESWTGFTPLELASPAVMAYGASGDIMEAAGYEAPPSGEQIMRNMGEDILTNSFNPTQGGTVGMLYRAFMGADSDWTDMFGGLKLVASVTESNIEAIEDALNVPRPNSAAVETTEDAMSVPRPNSASVEAIEGAANAPRLESTMSSDSTRVGRREREAVEIVVHQHIDSERVGTTRLADVLNRRSAERAISNR